MSLVDGDWDHDNERTQPDRAEHPVRVGDGLPASRPQRPADGKVALQRYGDQSQRTDAHRHSCVHDIRRTHSQSLIANRNFSTPPVSAATPRWIFTVITERIEYKLLSLTYKVLTITQPECLHNLTVLPPLFHSQLRRQNLPLSQIFPTVDSLLASGLTSRTS